MPSLVERLMELSPEQMQEFRRWTDSYESAWAERPHPAPRPDAFVPADDPPARLVLIQNAKVALEYLAGSGTPVDPESFLAGISGLSSDREALVELLAWGSRLADSSPGSGVEPFALPALAERYPTLREAIVERRSALYREQGGVFPPELVPPRTRLLHELPRGGMSRLALIWDEDVGREEVLKIIDPLGRDIPEAMERFRREFRLAGDRAGSRVVPVYRAGSIQGHLYYTMPHLRGGSLRDRLRKGNIALRDGVRVLADVARSVHLLHTEQPQLIHRDIKPENLLFAGPEFAEPWIGDLGLARLIAETADPALTGPGDACLGTPGYMAPEQIHDDTRKAGPTADVHALGAILYELLTGRPPFYDHNRAVAIRQTLEQDPLRPSGVSTRPVPPDLEVIALKALRKEPSERFRTAAEFADELDRWSAGLPIRSRPPTAWTHIRSVIRRYPRTSAATAASVIALLSLSILSFALYLRAAAQQRRADVTSRGVVGILRKQAEQIVSESDPRRMSSERATSLDDIARFLQLVVQENDGDGSPELGTALNGLAVIDLALGKIDAALDATRKAEKIFAALPPTFEARYGRAAATMQTGRLLFSSGQLAEGEAATREATGYLRTLAAEQPDNQDVRLRLALAEMNLGNFAREKSPMIAEHQYREAIKHWDALCRKDGSQPIELLWYAKTQSNLGLLMAEHGNATEAIPIHTAAIDRADQLARILPDDKKTVDTLGTCRVNMGSTLIAAGRPADAIPVLEGAIRAYEDLAARSPDETEGPWGAAQARTLLADALSRLGRWNEALPLLELAGATYETIRKNRADDPDLIKDLVFHHNLLDRAKKATTPKS